MIKLYTDGACRGNQFRENKGAWAYLLLADSECHLKGCSTPIRHEESGAVNNTTNNRMELTAVIEGLKRAFTTEVTVYSDSEYVVNTINQNWKRRKNLDLWLELDKLIDDKTTFKHVKGHSNNKYNNYVDSLCNKKLDEH